MKTLTCIVGLVQDGVVYMGGDSAGVNDSFDLRVQKNPKVFVVDGRFIIGFTNSFRMGQLLQYSLKVPWQKKSQDDYGYMCTTFINAVRKCFEKGGFMGEDDDDDDRETGGTFLVGYRGRLFTVEEDFQVSEYLYSCAAVGCGEDYAMGALFVTERLGSPPEERIRLALEAAAHFSAGVHPPFVIIRLPVR